MALFAMARRPSQATGREVMRQVEPTARLALVPATRELLNQEKSHMRKRLFYSCVIAALSAFALGGGVLASGGFGGPGTTTFHDLSATAALSDSSGTSLFISVDRGIQTFKLRGVSGPPVMVGPETVLNYSGSSPNGSVYNACFVIPDSKFTVASNLSTAALNVDPTVETPCPGFLVPAGSGGRPGLSGTVPEAGSGGGGGGEVPITASIVWTSNGAVTTSHFMSDSKCQGADAHATGSSKNTFASVAGTVSLLTDVTAQFATIGDTSNKEVITATFSAACTGA
jgi:hypothetical protein